MGKSNNSSGDEQYYSCELPNFELKFFAGPPLKEFAKASRHWVLGDGSGRKNKKKLGFENWSVAAFRGE